MYLLAHGRVYLSRPIPTETRAGAFGCACIATPDNNHNNPYKTYEDYCWGLFNADYLEPQPDDRLAAVLRGDSAAVDLGLKAAARRGNPCQMRRLTPAWVATVTNSGVISQFRRGVCQRETLTHHSPSSEATLDAEAVQGQQRRCEQERMTARSSC